MIRDMRRIWKQESPEEKLAKVRAAARKNPRKTIEKLLYIATAKPGAPLELFKLNRSQEIVYDAMMEQERAGKPVRIVILKSRQVGISTFCSAWVFVKTFFNQNISSLIMGHEIKATQKLFEKQKIFNANLPIELQIAIKRSNKQELFWEELINCMITVATAGSPDAVRSQTIHHGLFTEAGFYDELEDLKAGLEPSIHPYPGTSIIWESTGKGYGTGFHILWQSVSDGKSQYIPLFLKWYDDPLCSVEKFPNARIQDAMLMPLFEKFPDLRERQKEYKLTPEQICWYGTLLRDRYQGDQDRMSKEYPCTPEEAFLSGGKTVLPGSLIVELKKNIFPGKRYSVPKEGWQHISELQENLLIKPNQETYLEIWQPPIPGRHYLVSIDSAQGVATGDASCGMVLDILNQRLCAQIHGRVDMKSFAQMLAKIGTSYNYAIMVPEVDGLGAWLLAELKEIYFNLYQARKDLGYMTQVTNRLGFDMREHKLAAVANMKNLLRDRHKEHGFMPCQYLLSELSTYINKDGKPQAQKSCHDDRVAAYAIGLKACFDEIQSRPDLTRLLLSTNTTDHSTVRPRTTPDEIIRRMKDPNWIPGYSIQDQKTAGDLGPISTDDLGDPWDWQW